jgi:hypothetical protein
MDAHAVYMSILEDMRSIWGELAIFMLKKRVQDVEADPESLTREDLLKIVKLLQEKTLPSTLGPEGANRKAAIYRSWINRPDS